MLLLPGQGVDTVMAFEELCRSDTTLKCFGMNMSDKRQENFQATFDARKFMTLVIESKN